MFLTELMLETCFNDRTVVLALGPTGDAVTAEAAAATARETANNIALRRDGDQWAIEKSLEDDQD